MQLQTTDALFGISDTSGSSTDSIFSALAQATSSETSTSSSTSSSSLADQIAAYQGNLQTQEAQTLLGVNQPTTNQSSLFDVFA